MSFLLWVIANIETVLNELNIIYGDTNASVSTIHFIVIYILYLGFTLRIIRIYLKGTKPTARLKVTNPYELPYNILSWGLDYSNIKELIFSDLSIHNSFKETDPCASQAANRPLTILNREFEFTEMMKISKDREKAFMIQDEDPTSLNSDLSIRNPPIPDKITIANREFEFKRLLKIFTV